MHIHTHATACSALADCSHRLVLNDSFACAGVGSSGPLAQTLTAPPLHRAPVKHTGNLRESRSIPKDLNCFLVVYTVPIDFYKEPANKMILILTLRWSQACASQENLLATVEVLPRPASRPCISRLAHHCTSTLGMPRHIYGRCSCDEHVTAMMALPVSYRCPRIACCRAVKQAGCDDGFQVPAHNIFRCLILP